MAAVATGIGSARAPRWVVAALVGSLALNLVVIGAIAHSLWRENVEPSGTPAERACPAQVVGYAVTLPPERVKELKRLTEEQWRSASSCAAPCSMRAPKPSRRSPPSRSTGTLSGGPVAVCSRPTRGRARPTIQAQQRDRAQSYAGGAARLPALARAAAAAAKPSRRAREAGQRGAEVAGLRRAANVSCRTSAVGNAIARRPRSGLIAPQTLSVAPCISSSERARTTRRPPPVPQGPLRPRSVAGAGGGRAPGRHRRPHPDLDGPGARRDSRRPPTAAMRRCAGDRFAQQCSRAWPVRAVDRISISPQSSTTASRPPGLGLQPQRRPRPPAASVRPGTRSRRSARRSAISADMVAATARASSEALSRRPPLSLMWAAYS